MAEPKTQNWFSESRISKYQSSLIVENVSETFLILRRNLVLGSTLINSLLTVIAELTITM